MRPVHAQPTGAAIAPDRHDSDTAMNAPIVFHFDFSSPYGYIASEKIEGARFDAFVFRKTRPRPG